MQRGGRKKHADGEDADALENAQRTRIEVHDELSVVRVRQQRGAGEGAQRIGGA